MGHGWDMEGIWRGCRWDYGGTQDTEGKWRGYREGLERTQGGHGGGINGTWRNHGEESGGGMELAWE